MSEEILTSLEELDQLREVIAELKWRIEDTRDHLLRRNANDESYFNLDEWSTPIVNLRLAIEYANNNL